MKKIFFLFFILVFYNLSAENLSFEQCLNKYKNAFAELEKHHSKITVSKYWIDHRTIVYNQGYYTHDAGDALNKYHDAYNAFIEKIYVNAYVDGVFFGFIAACLNRYFKRELCDPITLGSLVCATICRTIQQNYHVGKIPYFDQLDLKKKDNLFYNFDKSFCRLFLMLAGQAVSYFGTQYCFYRLLG